MASAMETAVDAADERPHFLMRAPPRVATTGVKLLRNQSSSLMTSEAGLPSIVAFTQSGTWENGNLWVDGRGEDGRGED